MNMKKPLKPSVRVKLDNDIPYILFLIFGIPLFFPLIFSGKIPGPFAYGVTDIPVFMEPYALSFINALRLGYIPFWNESSSFGAPVLLTLGSGTLHPFHLLHLVLPDWLAFAIGWWLRLALFATYSFLFLRELGIRRWLALSFAVSLTFGNWYLNYSAEIIGYVMAFFPMAFFHADRLLSISRRRDFILLSVAVASLIMGGFLSVTLYALLILGSYILFTTPNRRAFIMAATACLVGCLLVLPAIVETLFFYPTTGYDIGQRNWLFSYTSPAYTFFNWVIPSIFGNIMEYSAAGERDFFGRLLGSGVLSFPLSLAGFFLIIRERPFRNNRKIIFWALVLLVTLACYFDLFHVKNILRHIPIINEHPLTRLQAFIAIGSAFFAACAAEYALKRYDSVHSARSFLLLVWFPPVAVFAGMLYLFDNPVFTKNIVLYGILTGAAIVGLFLCFSYYAKFGAKVVTGASLAIAICTSWTYTLYFSPEDYYPESELIITIKKNLLPGARILDVNNVLFQNTAIAYDIPSLTNHWFSKPSLRDAVRSVSVEKDRNRKGLSLDVITSLDPNLAWPILRRLHTQFVSLSFTENQGWLNKPSLDWKIVGREKDIVLLEVLSGKTSNGKESLNGVGYEHFSQQQGRIRFTPTTEEWISIPVRMYRGWSIVKGAVELRDASNSMMLVLPEHGAKTVELEYFPKYFWPLLVIGPISMFTCIWLLFPVLNTRRN